MQSQLSRRLGRSQFALRWACLVRLSIAGCDRLTAPARRVPAGTALYLSLDPGLALVDLGADFELELLRLVLAGLDLLLDPGLALIDLGADFVLDRFDVLLDLGESFGTLLLEIVPETYLPSTV